MSPWKKAFAIDNSDPKTAWNFGTTVSQTAPIKSAAADAPAFSAGQMRSQLAITTPAIAATAVSTKPTGPNAPAIATAAVRAAVTRVPNVCTIEMIDEPRAITLMSVFPAMIAPMA